MLCATLLRGVEGGQLDGVYGIGAALVVPAVALGETMWAGVCWCRKGAAGLLRRAAECLDALPQGVPVPVVTAEACRAYDEGRMDEWALHERAGLHGGAEYLDGFNAGRAEALADVAALQQPTVVAPVLVMAGAAQETDEGIEMATAVAADPALTLSIALEDHGTVRSAAKALGIAESTFRSRCKKLGVAMPGRKRG